jgi:hypothetical protein
MTDTTKFKNVSLSKKTYSDVGLLSKEYLVDKEMKKVKKGQTNGHAKKE